MLTKTIENPTPHLPSPNNSLKTSTSEVGSRINVSSWSILAVWIVITLILTLTIAMTAPFQALLGESSFSVVGTVHGMLATFGILVGTVTAYLGWRLFIGQLKAFYDLRILAALSTAAAVFTVIFGNWVYIAYRGPGGPRAYFISQNPAIHEIFFEFKEHIALFTIPLAVAATYILWKYRETLPENNQLRTAVAVLTGVGWLALMITFTLGAAVTKLRSV